MFDSTRSGSSGLAGRTRLGAAVLLGVYALFVARFWFVCDDAFITFRFARNLARGIGLVFNPGELPPVEGYSDFLWLLAAFGFEAVGLRPDRFLPVLSALCGALLVVRVHRTARDRLELGGAASLWGAMVVAASPAIGCWATSGLETMPQALLTFLLFERVVLDRWRWVAGVEGAPGEWIAPALLGIGLALIRIEGISWVAVVLGVSIVARRLDGAPMRPHLAFLARIAAPVGAVFVLWTAWRFQYYGTLVPNTALVKVGFGLPLLERGAKYVALFLATTLVPLAGIVAAPLALRTGHRGAMAAVVLLALAFPLYGVAVGGDFMPFGRLLVPGMPFVGLLVSGGLSELVRRRRGQPALAHGLGVGMLLVSALPSFDLHLVPDRVRRTLHFRLSDKAYLSELNRWQNQRENTDGFTRRGRALARVASPGDAVVAAAVGAVGYWSGITVYDQHGLVTKEVAYRPLPEGPLTQSPGHDKHVEPEFFVRYEPRFLYARAVEGTRAAGRMKDTLDQWEVPRSVMDRYVPDYYEVTPEGAEERAFLFVVRLRTADEDPARLWAGFSARRRALNAELRENAASDSDDRDTSG